MILPPSPIDRVLTIVVLGLLIAGCYLVLAPFLTAILWAAILCVTTWPLFVRLRWRLGGSGSLAALIMVLVIALALLAPFVIVGATIAENSDQVAAFVQGQLAAGPPDPPAWLANFPLLGPHAAAYWARFTHDTAAFVGELSKYVEPFRKFALAIGVTVLGGLLQLALSIVIAFFFYRDGDAMIVRVHAAVTRIAGQHGHHLTHVAAMTTRGVVLGILGTALVQGTLMAIGLALAGIKAAPLLGFLVVRIGRDVLGYLRPRVGRARRVDGRQLHSPADHQPRQRPAVHPRADRRAGWRCGVRTDRPFSRPGVDRRRLHPAAPMGERYAGQRAGTGAAGARRPRGGKRRDDRSGLIGRYTGEQNAAPFGA